MKSAAVLTVDGAFALFLHLCGRAWQLKCPSPWEFAIHSKRLMPMPCPGVHWVGGGMLGGVGSPKIDWCIIVALLLIQALVEDKQLRSLITRTKSLSSQPNHSSFIFSTCLLHSRGEEAEPFFVCFFFLLRGFHWAKIIVFFFFLREACPICMSPSVLAGCYNCFHNLSASFWTVTHSLALRLIQFALSLE